MSYLPSLTINTTTQTISFTAVVNTLYNISLALRSVVVTLPAPIGQQPCSCEFFITATSGTNTISFSGLSNISNGHSGPTPSGLSNHVGVGIRVTNDGTEWFGGGS